MTIARPRRVLPATFLFVLGLSLSASGALPKVPEGFEIRLVATVPAVLYPCQVATAPGGELFVAEDPMDQVGPYEANHGRILLFRDGKDPVVFADGFRAVQGMAWHGDVLYVSHMPFLTVLRDADGDGKADERKDIFKDLGPTDNQGLNDHIVSGIQFGMDGYLYISVGDKGIPKATGPDGRTIQIKGGGTCRCRPDGTGLEVISTGTRNHLEANLDDRDNIFSYDNTDDGLGWWTRVTHHVDSGYYGYPYDYHKRPDRHLPRMAEFGGGSPCGAVLYKEDAWPEKFRGVGFWAEWGKGKVHAFRFAPDGSTFKVAEPIDFAVPEGVDNFRPIDLAISYDGKALYIADWGMGSWGSKTEKVGRVWAVTAKETIKTRPRGKDTDPVEAQVAQLDHPSFNERMRAQTALIKEGRESLAAVSSAWAASETSPVARRHLVWVIDGVAGGTPEGTALLVEALKSGVSDVRAQAARALGERAVSDAVDPLVSLLADHDPTVRLQAVIALGRIKSSKAIPALLPHLIESDDFIAFSTRQALRRIGDWKAVASGLTSDNAKLRQAVLATMEEVYDLRATMTLARFANDRGRDATERARAILYLSQVHHKAKPWDGVWWKTQPAAGKPPAKVDAWDGTPVVLATIQTLLVDPSAPVLLAAINAVKETGDRGSLPTLRTRYKNEPVPETRLAIAQAWGELDDKDALPLLAATLRDKSTPEPLHDASIAAVEKIGSDLAIQSLVGLLGDEELAGARKARVIAALGRFKATAAVGALVASLKDPEPSVRATAAESLGKIGQLEGAGAPLRAVLADPSLEVKRAAILALGALSDREAIPALTAASEVPDTHFEAIRALAMNPDLLALQAYLGGLTDKSPELRTVSAGAIAKIRDQAAPILDQLASRHELSPTAVPELRKVYSSLQPLLEWRLLGPFKIDDAKAPFAPEGPIDLNASYTSSKGEPATWTAAKASDDQGRVDLDRIYSGLSQAAAFGYVEVSSQEDRTAQCAVGSDDTLTVWINGTQVYDTQASQSFSAARTKFDVKLTKGVNRVLIRCGNHGGPWAFSVALSTASDYAFLKGPSAGAFDPEAFRQAALKVPGKPEHGRVLFEDLKGLACIKCHSVGKQGGMVGPELSSVGAKYSRDELIASVLFPSAKISSGYEPVILATSDGKVLTGIVKSDGDDAVEIEDADAKRIRIPKDSVDDRKRSDVSLMPSGLAEGLTPQDFADLIAYLQTLKDPGVKAETPAKVGASGEGR